MQFGIPPVSKTLPISSQRRGLPAPNLSPLPYIFEGATAFSCAMTVFPNNKQPAVDFSVLVIGRRGLAALGLVACVGAMRSLCMPIVFDIGLVV
jgi:hypothetical protein